MIKYLTCLTLLLIQAIISNAQYKRQGQQILVGFYNCENLYDTINQANVVDEEFLPNSEKKFPEKIFEK